MTIRSLHHRRVAAIHILRTKFEPDFAQPKPREIRVIHRVFFGGIGLHGIIITGGLFLYIRSKYKDELKESAPNLQVPNMMLSRSPVEMMVCPNCSETNIRTRTRTYPVRATWTLVVIGAIFHAPLCWIPMLVDRFKQTDHYCQRCGKKVGEIGPFRDFFVTERV